MKCNLCPRHCGVDRSLKGGFCGAQNLRVAKVMKHFWEEPIISGTNGSGAIFFSHCSLKCCFCQNYEISHLGKGEDISVQKLAEIFKELENSGVHNINLVSPTHYTNEIIEALKIYKPNIPIVWNTNSYEEVETIKKLKDYVDIYLADLKVCSKEISSELLGAPNYFERASQAILEMRKNQPVDVIENGIMKKGIIVRHLVMPTYQDDSLKILDWINENLGNETYISLMSQYTPCYKAKFPIDRKLKPLEYKIVLKKCEKLGFCNGFTQEFSSASTNYIPKF